MRRWCSIVGFALAIAVLAISVTTDSRTAHAQIGIGINITIAPPELPVYDQPPLPGPGYLWIPGYWAWADPDGYYWVPGYWEEPPAVGLLWTPGYWGWRDGYYAWNEGYWGPHIGFYGGVNYGCGYTGEGYYGGRWDHGVFAYNQSVNNFGGVHITNVYSQTVVVNNVTRVSFNGGTGGTTAQATPQQLEAAHEHHVPPTALQTQHQQTASTNPALRASENHGRPTIAAVSKPNEFTGKGVVAAHEATPANLTHEEKPGGAGANSHALTTNSPNVNLPNAVNPNGAKTLGTNTANPNGKTPEKQGLTTLGNKEPGGSQSKTPNTTPKTEMKTLGNNPPKPPKPQPRIVSAPNPPKPPQPQPPAPHPMAVAHPPAPHPAAPRPPAPHPQARPAPHPNNNKKPS